MSGERRLCICNRVEEGAGSHTPECDAQPVSAAQPGELREALVHIARAMNPMLHDPLMTTIAEQWVDEHILPVVTAYAEQQARARAAEELRSAADSIRYQLPGFIGRVDTADALDDRAADLAADDRTDPA